MSEKPKPLDRPPTLRDLAGFAGLFATATALWLGAMLVLGSGIFIGVMLKELWRH